MDAHRKYTVVAIAFFGYENKQKTRVKKNTKPIFLFILLASLASSNVPVNHGLQGWYCL